MTEENLGTLTRRGFLQIVSSAIGALALSSCTTIPIENLPGLIQVVQDSKGIERNPAKDFQRKGPDILLHPRSGFAQTYEKHISDALVDSRL